MPLTEEERKKGYLSFENEVVNPTTNTVVRRYTDPAAPQGQVLGASIVAGQESAFSTGGSTVRRNLPPAASIPSTSPTVGQTFTPTPLLTADQFAAQRSGAVDENAIREETRKQLQAQIDATDAYYADLVSREQDAGNARLAKVNAINVNSGLGGSNFATSRDLEQRGLNDKALKAVENEKNVQLQAIYGKIDQTARDEIKAKKAEALGNADAYATYLEKARESSRGDMAALASAGIDLDQLDQNRRDYLLKSAGYDPELGSLVYNSLKPKQSQIDYKFANLGNGRGLFYGVSPTTGELKQIEANVDIPPDFKFHMADDGTPLIFNPQTGEARIMPGFAEGQFRKPFANELGGGGDIITRNNTSSTNVSAPINARGESLSPQAEAVLNGTLRLEDLTPTTRGKIAGELNAAGYKSNQRLPAGVQEDLATMKTVEDQINKLLEFNTDGKLEGIGGFAGGSLKGFFAKNLGWGSEEGKSVRALIGNIKGTIAKLRGGTSFTPNEEKLLDSYVPGVNDDGSVIVNKLGLLKTFIDSKRQNSVQFGQERTLPTDEGIKIEDLRSKYNY